MKANRFKSLAVPQCQRIHPDPTNERPPLKRFISLKGHLKPTWERKTYVCGFKLRSQATAGVCLLFHLPGSRAPFRDKGDHVIPLLPSGEGMIWDFGLENGFHVGYPCHQLTWNLSRRPFKRTMGFQPLRLHKSLEIKPFEPRGESEELHHPNLGGRWKGSKI